MKSQFFGIAAVCLPLALSAPALAKTNWTVNFANNSGRSVWVMGLDDTTVTKVSNGGHRSIEWKEDNCPPSWANAYFIVYAAKDAQEEDTIFEETYKYDQGKNHCKLKYTGSAWYNDYDKEYTTVDQANENHKRRLTLKPK